MDDWENRETLREWHELCECQCFMFYVSNMRVLDMTFRRLLGMTLSASLVLTIAMVNQTDADVITIVGGSTLNGDFNADTSTDVSTFAETPFWENIGTGDQTKNATRVNKTFDGTRNADIRHEKNRQFGLDTKYDLVTGDVFDVSYVWRDDNDWVDTEDQIVVSLFVTDDNLITGNRFSLIGLFSGLSTADSTYELVEHASAFTALSANAGQRLFVSIDTFHPTATSGNARLDNFTLKVTTVPEPSAFLLGCVSLLGFVVLRSRWQ